MSVCEEVDVWLNVDNGSFWYGNSLGTPFIYVSSGPSGLVVTGGVDESIGIGWMTKFCAQLSIPLNREIYAVEM